MDYDDLILEIDIKYGEILEILPDDQIVPMYIQILTGMLMETRIENNNLKERLKKCQQ